MSDDLRAVRDFMQDRVIAPSPRLRQRVVAGARPRPRRWPAYRWAVPLVAAFVALAVLAGVGLVLRRGGDDAALHSTRNDSRDTTDDLDKLITRAVE